MKTSALILAALTLCACRRDMQDQPKLRPLQSSTFFLDGRSSRPIPANTVALDELEDTGVLYTGGVDGNFAETIPIQIDRTLLERGHERYEIYCTPCHGYLGDGDGMVTRRGFKQPTDLNSERVRQEPPGYIFQVISNGFGAMPDYRDQIPPHDRWAIVAYLRALQLSRNAPAADVPESERASLDAAGGQR